MRFHQAAKLSHIVTAHSAEQTARGRNNCDARDISVGVLEKKASGTLKKGVKKGVEATSRDQEVTTTKSRLRLK